MCGKVEAKMKTGTKKKKIITREENNVMMDGWN